MFLELKLKFACTKMVSSVSGHSWKEKNNKTQVQSFKKDTFAHCCHGYVWAAAAIHCSAQPDRVETEEAEMAFPFQICFSL